MYNKTVIGLGDAESIVEAAIAEAKSRGVCITVAVIDCDGIPVVMKRMDHARSGTAPFAMRKAFTAGQEARPTSEDEGKFIKLPFLRYDDYAPKTGGLPIMHKGECIGGIGVSGTDPKGDAEIARAALVTTGWLR